MIQIPKVTCHLLSTSSSASSSSDYSFLSSKQFSCRLVLELFKDWPMSVHPSPTPYYYTTILHCTSVLELHLVYLKCNLGPFLRSFVDLPSNSFLCGKCSIVMQIHVQYSFFRHRLYCKWEIVRKIFHGEILWCNSWVWSIADRFLNFVGKIFKDIISYVKVTSWKPWTFTVWNCVHEILCWVATESVAIMSPFI